MSESELHTENSNADSGPDRSTAHVGLVCTHAKELRPFLKQLDRRRGYTDAGMKFTGGFLDEFIRVAVVEAGPGFAAHRRATESLIEEHCPSWVVSAGFSASLSADVLPGDLSLATSIRDTHGQLMDVDCPIPESKHATLGPHLVADQHPVSAEERSGLAATWDAAAVDTTSLAVAQICQAKEHRFLSIRAILEGGDDDVPETVIRSLIVPQAASGNSVGKWLSSLRKPPQLREWEQRADTVSRRLSRFLVGVVQQIGEQLRNI